MIQFFLTGCFQEHRWGFLHWQRAKLPVRYSFYGQCLSSKSDWKHNQPNLLLNGLKNKIDQYFVPSNLKTSRLTQQDIVAEFLRVPRINILAKQTRNDVPLMTALKYFISCNSSNVGLLESPTTDNISSRSLQSTSGC